MTQDVAVVNELGLHARAASRLVKLARRFEADIQVECEGRVVDGRSIVGLLTLAAGRGKHLTLSASGTDAPEALDALASLVAGGFDEGAGDYT